ncbi:MAG: 50S ribosomal protein L15 [Patescibacteria group bacterium]|jgi:large subunit ribosomal protein L15
MAISLSNLRPGKGAKSDKKRVGRGLGSKGTTAGRGQKGQSSRSGVGGLKRLGMRHTILATPKNRGFKSLQDKSATISVGDLEKTTIASEMVTPKVLAKKGLIKAGERSVKVLGDGEITHAITIKGCEVSASAKDKIEKMGGKIE